MSDVEDDVRAAYRWVLGREADEGGLAHYAAAIRSGELTLPALRRIFLDSDEFGGRKPGYVTVDIAHSVKVVVDPGEPEFGRYIVGGGSWEPHIIAAIRSNLPVGGTFIDIGGNVGVMSLQAAQAVGPQGKVIAFEPNWRNVDAFRRGIVANNFENVILYPLALSDRRQIIGLTATSNAKVIGESTALQIGDVVQAIPADEILEHENRIDLVKIDVEGFELPVLKGMERSLRRHQPRILCEFNPLCLRAQGHIEPDILADYLFGLSSTGELVEHDGSRTPVRSARELMDLWQRRDAEAAAKGILPAGWVHFDILLDMADDTSRKRNDG